MIGPMIGVWNWTVAEGVSPPLYDYSLSFNQIENSQYLPLIFRQF
jgi:hypothetical protein